MVAFIHLHGIPQRAGRSRYDRNLLNRSGIGLFGRHERMADLVICDNLLFLIRKNGVLLLIAGDHHLYAFFQISLLHIFSAVPYSAQRRFVYDIRQFCAGCA